jgi:hypothetical protein
MISDHPEAALAPEESGPVKLTLIFSRIWYVFAAAITIGLIAAAGALLHLIHAPVARLLWNVALCATSWSHGICAWH